MKLKKLWEYKIEGIRQGGGRTPLVTDRLVIFSVHGIQKTYNRSFIACYDKTAMQLLWQKDLNQHLITEPAYLPSTDSAVFSEMNGVVTSYQVATGHTNWETKLELINCGIWGPIHWTSDLLIIPEIHGKAKYLYCLNPQTGNFIWKWESGCGIYKTLLSNKQLFISQESSLAKVDLISGSQLSKLDHPAIHTWCKIFNLDPENILVGTHEVFLVVGKESLTVVAQNDNPENIILTSVCKLSNRLLAIAQNGSIYQINYSGSSFDLSLLFSVSLPNPLEKVIHYQDNLYLLISDGYITLVDINTQAQLFSKSLYKSTVTAAFSENNLFVTTANGILLKYALEN